MAMYSIKVNLFSYKDSGKVTTEKVVPNLFKYQYQLRDYKQYDISKCSVPR